MRSMRKFISCALAAIMLFSPSFIAGSWAQAVKGADKIEGSCFSVENDIKSYDIMLQPGDNGKDYTEYSKLVREKIKRKLENAYIDYYKEGDVKALFTLRYDGSLVSLKTMPDSTKDLRLTDIVISCIKKASPFPRFPGALSSPQASFCVVISFNPPEGTKGEGASALPPMAAKPRRLHRP